MKKNSSFQLVGKTEKAAIVDFLMSKFKVIYTSKKNYLPYQERQTKKLLSNLGN